MFSKKADNPMKDFIINLELFSDGVSAGNPAAPAAAPVTSGGEPPSTGIAASVEPTATPTTGEPQKFNSFSEFWDHAQGASEQPIVQPATQPAPIVDPAVPGQPAVTEPQGLQVPDKFKNPDGTINAEAVLKSYLNMEPKLTELGTAKATLEKQLQDFQARQNQGPQPGQPQPTQQPAQQPVQQQPSPQQWTPEQQKAFSDKWMDEFYENGPQAVVKLAEHVAKSIIEAQVNPMIKPIVDRHESDQQVAEWNNQVNVVKGKYQDFDQYKDAMGQILNEPVTDVNGKPALGPDGSPMTMGEYLSELPNAVEFTYNLAKSRQVQARKTPEELMNDPDFIKQVMGNETVKNGVLKANMEAIRAGAPPVVIGGQVGGAPPAAPPEKINSTEEAGKAFRGFMNRLGFGGS